MPQSDHPPGAGEAAAETALVAANLCEELARAAGRWDDAAGAATQAAHLKNRALSARDANVAAYAAARRQLAVPAGSSTGRDGMLAAALLASADSLLAIGTIAADTAVLAAEMAAHLSADTRPDALGAAELAVGAASAAAELVAVNLALSRQDSRREQADASLARARSAADSARRALLN